jgi:hypothetical protein
MSTGLFGPKTMATSVAALNINPSDISTPMITSLFLERAKANSTYRNPFLVAIRQTADSLRDGEEQQTEERRLEQMCTLAVTHLGPHSAFDHLKSDSTTCGNPNENEHTKNALTASAYVGNIEMLRTLVIKGANINSASKYLGKPLWAAAKQGHDE